MRENFVYRYGDNLYVNLTNKCCNSCDFCIRKNGDGIGDSGCLWLDREPAAKECIDLIEEFLHEEKGFNEVVFCGYGEPTYCLDNMIKIADYVHSVGKKTRLNTNGLGSLINDKDVAKELKGKLDVVSVSLNADNEVSYDKICHSVYGTAAFEEMLNFAKECKDLGINTVLSIVAVPGVDIEKCKELSERIGVPLRVREYIK